MEWITWTLSCIGYKSDANLFTLAQHILEYQTKQIDNVSFMYHMIQCVRYKCYISTLPKTNDSIRKFLWPSTRFEHSESLHGALALSVRRQFQSLHQTWYDPHQISSHDRCKSSIKMRNPIFCHNYLDVGQIWVSKRQWDKLKPQRQSQFSNKMWPFILFSWCKYLLYFRTWFIAWYEDWENTPAFWWNYLDYAP